nr:hypothetical protein [Tanacetum cinerariifolium]
MQREGSALPEASLALYRAIPTYPSALPEASLALYRAIPTYPSANFTIVGRALKSTEIARSLGHYKSECPIVKFHEHVDMILGRMRASKPKTMQDAMEIANKLRNKKISTLVECETKNKKRLDNTSKNNQNQQQPNKRQNTGIA